MKLKRGVEYNHTTSGGINICIYSHSDSARHNHFFTVIDNAKEWNLDELNQVSIPTWDLERNMAIRTPPNNN